jgi:hypothetical protein
MRILSPMLLTSKAVSPKVNVFIPCSKNKIFGGNNNVKNGSFVVIKGVKLVLFQTAKNNVIFPYVKLENGFPFVDQICIDCADFYICVNLFVE